jgi:hypothetical protein
MVFEASFKCCQCASSIGGRRRLFLAILVLRETETVNSFKRLLSARICVQIRANVVPIQQARVEMLAPFKPAWILG